MNIIQQLNTYKRIHKTLLEQLLNWVDHLINFDETDNNNWEDLQGVNFVIEDWAAEYSERDIKHFDGIMNLIFELSEEEFNKYIEDFYIEKRALKGIK